MNTHHLHLLFKVYMRALHGVWGTDFWDMRSRLTDWDKMYLMGGEL